MKNIYQSLILYDTDTHSNCELSSKELESKFCKGLALGFTDSEQNVSVILCPDGNLQICRHSDHALVVYELLPNLKILAQIIELTDNKNTLCFLCNEETTKWDRASLLKDNKPIASYLIVPPSDNAEMTVHLTVPEDVSAKKCDIAFNKQMLLRANENDSYRAAYDVDQIMKKSFGLIREDMSTEIVCEMFELTKEELSMIPALLVEKSKLLP